MRQATLIAAVALTSGCATLFSGGPEPVTFISAPEGAEVLIDGYPVGKTPLTVEIDRKAFGQHIITMRAPGYQTRQFPLQKSLNITAIFNLSFLTFWATDATTGALITYEPNSYYFELQMAGAPPATDRRRRSALYFTLVNHRRLREQIARRGGEHLEALAKLLEVPADRLVDTLSERAPQLVTLPYPHHLFAVIEAEAATIRAPRLPPG